MCRSILSHSLSLCPLYPHSPECAGASPPTVCHYVLCTSTAQNVLEHPLPLFVTVSTVSPLPRMCQRITSHCLSLCPLYPHCPECAGASSFTVCPMSTVSPLPRMCWSILFHCLSYVHCIPTAQNVLEHPLPLFVTMSTVSPLPRMCRSIPSHCLSLCPLYPNCPECAGASPPTVWHYSMSTVSPLPRARNVHASLLLQRPESRQ
jgi:hypothetical protein